MAWELNFRRLQQAAEEYVKPKPPFHGEGPNLYQAALAHNIPFAQDPKQPSLLVKDKPGDFQTTLSPIEESFFQRWLKNNHVPFDPTESPVDYDMRGYWDDTHGGGWSQGQHFPDTFKTPYDTSFSNESQYATSDNPFEWRGEKLIDRRSGRVVYE